MARRYRHGPLPLPPEIDPPIPTARSSQTGGESISSRSLPQTGLCRLAFVGADFASIRFPVSRKAQSLHRASSSHQTRCRWALMGFLYIASGVLAAVGTARSRSLARKLPLFRTTFAGSGGAHSGRFRSSPLPQPGLCRLTDCISSAPFCKSCLRPSRLPLRSFGQSGLRFAPPDLSSVPPRPPDCSPADFAPVRSALVARPAAAGSPSSCAAGVSNSFLVSACAAPASRFTACADRRSSSASLDFSACAQAGFLSGSSAKAVCALLRPICPPSLRVRRIVLRRFSSGVVRECSAPFRKSCLRPSRLPLRFFGQSGLHVAPPDLSSVPPRPPDCSPADFAPVRSHPVARPAAAGSPSSSASCGCVPAGKRLHQVP